MDKKKYGVFTKDITKKDIEIEIYSKKWSAIQYIIELLKEEISIFYEEVMLHHSCGTTSISCGTTNVMEKWELLDMIRDHLKGYDYIQSVSNGNIYGICKITNNKLILKNTKAYMIASIPL